MPTPWKHKELRVSLLVLAAASLLTALWAGLVRAGWPLSLLHDHHPLAHGPLLLCGFLGTVIGLEKASAIERTWAYLAPFFAAVGAIRLILRPDPFLASVAFVVASAILILVFGALLMRRTDFSEIVMLGGVLAWLVGNLIWMTGRSMPTAISWWLAFPILIIVGERLELSRIVPKPPRAMATLKVALGIYLTGIVWIVWNIDFALRFQGLGLLLIAAWLLRFDLARRTVRSSGVHRYTALCLLLGFVWLAVGGGLAAICGIHLQGLRYDALIHSLLLGFVFGMIFGHAPIIAPMLLGRRIAFDRLFYAPLILLQISLALRIGSDLAGWLPGRSWGALLNVASVLLFLITTVRGVVRGKRIG